MAQTTTGLATETTGGAVTAAEWNTLHGAVDANANDAESRISSLEGGVNVSTPETKTAGYTLTSADAGKTLLFDSTSGMTLTIPDGSLAPGEWVGVIQINTGAVTFAQGGTATVNSRDNLVTDGQWSEATVYCYGTDQFVVSGALTTA